MEEVTGVSLMGQCFHSWVFPGVSVSMDKAPSQAPGIPDVSMAKPNKTVRILLP
jgi:hypothetical protein